MLPSKHQVSYSHCTFLITCTCTCMYLTWIFSQTAVSHVKYIRVSCRCMSEYFHLYKHGKRLTKEKFPNFKDKKQYMTCMKFKTFIKHSSYFADPVFHIARCAPAGLFIKFKMSKPTFFSWFLSVRSWWILSLSLLSSLSFFLVSWSNCFCKWSELALVFFNCKINNQIHVVR